MKRVIFYRILINVFWQTQNAVEGRSRVFLNVHHRISDKRGTLKRKEDVLYLKPGGGLKPEHSSKSTIPARPEKRRSISPGIHVHSLYVTRSRHAIVTNLTEIIHSGTAVFDEYLLFVYIFFTHVQILCFLPCFLCKSYIMPLCNVY